MDSLFGIHEQALLLRARRSEVLAENLANADTPQYKARDLDFAATLAAEQKGGQGSISMARTDAQHLSTKAATAQHDLKFRVPYQPARDGNTVETDLELSRFAENSVSYQATLMFINGRIASLRNALTGGR